MEFEPQNAFERALEQAADDPAHIAEFYKELVSADLFFVPRNADNQVSRSPKLDIEPVEDEGQEYLPVFSSLVRVKESSLDDGEAVSLNAVELLKLTDGAELLLNPDSKRGKIFTREEIEMILDGSITHAFETGRIEQPAEVMIGQPTEYPHELVEQLGKLFESIEQVERAYLVQIMHPAVDEAPHTLVGIVASGDWDDLLSRVAIVVQTVRVPDPPVDVVQVTGHTGVDEYMIHQCEPFFAR